MTVWWSFWDMLVLAGPFLLAGFLLAGVLAQLLPKAWVKRVLGGTGWKPVVAAAGLGVPLPLCSCSVIPFAVGLRQQGGSPAATVAFLVATPQTSVDSILLCTALIGPLFAWWPPLVALCAALIAGALVAMCVPPSAPVGTQSVATPAQASCCSTPAAEQIAQPSCCGGNKPQQAVATCCSQPQAASDSGTCAQDTSAIETPAVGIMQRLRSVILYGWWQMPQLIGRDVLVGLAIAAALAAFLPIDAWQSTVGNGLLGKAFMVVAAVPMYVCSTASVPVVAAMLAVGVSPGCALVYFLAGPATNAATVLTVRRIVGSRAMWCYLLSLIGAALLAGVLLDFVLPSLPVQEAMGAHEHGAWWQHAAAAVLLIVLLMGALRSFWPRKQGTDSCCAST